MTHSGVPPGVPKCRTRISMQRTLTNKVNIHKPKTKFTYMLRQRKQTRSANLTRENTPCFLDSVDVSFCCGCMLKMLKSCFNGDG